MFSILRIMTLVLFILAGIVPLVSSKEIARDDMGMKFDALLDRIEVLENNVRSQNFVIQSQHDKMAAMKETINTQAEELKTQRKSIAQLQDTTRKLRFDVKRLDRRVETLERKTIVPRTFHSAADVHQTNFDSAPFDHIGNSTASKDRGLGIKLNSGQAFDDELGRNRDPQAKQNQHVNEKASQKASTIKNNARRLLAPVKSTRVAFTAYLDKTLTHLGINHVIPFDKVLLNEGNGLNTNTGIFHCSQSGVYLFSLTIESHNKGAIVAKLVVDGNNQLDIVTDGSGGHYQTAGATAIVRLTSGQSVWVATYQNNDVTLFDRDIFRYTSFSGVLLF